ncbi:BKACE family enzyme [Algihabitans albus]|uniref:3-keto-5-aminohexanoate cleavage protein n=1 Tax=Algihabitans albus TaxID=2164067 RepID=UPI001F289092|nr:3-keto-5-aminohexanoate cleavage protein [Algihabitans albus]
MLAVAPNGARKTKSDHPALPIEPEEIAETAKACAAAGAAMIHLHVRDAKGQHSLDVGRYRAATEAIRAAVGQDLVIQVTTEAVGRFDPAEQMESVRRLEPEAASFALRELVPDAESETEAARFFAWVAEAGIQAQFILYDADDLRRFRALRRRGVLPAGPQFLLFVLGRYAAGQRSEPTDLLPFLALDEAADPWAICAFGPKEAAAAVTAAALGGHARVGFENNLLLPDGGIAKDNAALVAWVAESVGRLKRPLATAEQVRRLLVPS